LLGLSYFPGTGILAFFGSTATLGLLLLLSSGQTLIKKNSLLLSGVMVNAFCSAIIMLLVSMAHDTRLHNIIFWLMGNLSTADLQQTGFLAAILLPCFVLIFWLSNLLNLLLMGKDLAKTMGINIKAITLILLLTTSVMIGVTVSFCGLIGFVGLVVPHLLRLTLGSDHRVLVPACILGGGAYLIFCDLLAKTIPQQGELPAGVITAMVGAPLFIILLKRSGR
jgi:iron complex transport system permease protein